MARRLWLTQEEQDEAVAALCRYVATLARADRPAPEIERVYALEDAVERPDAEFDEGDLTHLRAAVRELVPADDREAAIVRSLRAKLEPGARRSA